MTGIRGFTGEYRFLSNFYPAKVYLGDIQFSTVEHAYQASKVFDIKIKKGIAKLNANQASKVKKLGRELPMRGDWDDIKLSVMEDLVRQKFTLNTNLGEKLLATGDSYIEETNNWGDTFWGVYRGVGQNNLGKILMMIRSEIKGQRL